MSVRWDAVVERTRALRADSPQPSPYPVDANDGVCVRVQLFGALAMVSPERTCSFHLPREATISDVLAALRHRVGESVAALLTDDAGAKRRSCRVFVDGCPVEDANAVLRATDKPTEIELILLVASEGG